MVSFLIKLYLLRVGWERDANVESLNGILGNLVLLFLIKRVLLEIAIHCPLDLQQYSTTAIASVPTFNVILGLFLGFLDKLVHKMYAQRMKFSCIKTFYLSPDMKKSNAFDESLFKRNTHKVVSHPSRW